VSTQPPDSGSESSSSGDQDTALSRKPLLLVFGVASVLLALDFLTKTLAIVNLEGREPLRTLGGAVYFVLVRNPGAAFSLGTGLTWLLALLAAGVVIAISWFAPKLRSNGWGLGLGLMLGGACGNLIDRLFRPPGPFRGYVVDFVSLFAPDGSVWPVFNVADSAIVCGGILVVILSLLGHDYDGTVHSKKRRAGGSA